MTSATDGRMRTLEEAAAGMVPGEEWIFRAQDDGPSRRVRIVGARRTPSNIQMDIEHLEAPRVGQRATVGLRRLKGPWSGVDAFDSHDRKRRDLEHSHRASHVPEHAAAEAVIGAMVPSHMMTRLSWPGRGVVVLDRDALTTLCAVPFAELVTAEDSLEVEEGLLVGAASVLRIAKAACTAHPECMTAELLKRERRLLLVPNSRQVTAAETGDGVTTILHEWCGTQPLEVNLRIEGLENDLSWQRALVRSATETLRACGLATIADSLAELSRRGARERYGREDHSRYGYVEDMEPSYAEVPW